MAPCATSLSTSLPPQPPFPPAAHPKSAHSETCIQHITHAQAHITRCCRRALPAEPLPIAESRYKVRQPEWVEGSRTEWHHSGRGSRQLCSPTVRHRHAARSNSALRDVTPNRNSDVCGGWAECDDTLCEDTSKHNVPDPH
eukprot:scaffold150812_cov27-Tisochrysis_lutea.AAC.1